MTNRELDALVAEKVMGLVVIQNWKCGYMPDCGNYEATMPAFTDDTFTEKIYPLTPSSEFDSLYDERGPVYELHKGIEPVPFYSTDIAAAWLVVEKLAQDGDEHPACIQKGLPAYGDHDTPFEVYKNYAGYPGWTCYFADYEVCAHADTAPLAICLAAIKAVGVEVGA